MQVKIYLFIFQTKLIKNMKKYTDMRNTKFKIVSPGGGRERNATGDREGPKWATDATQCLACKRHPVKRNYYNSSNYY